MVSIKFIQSILLLNLFSFRATGAKTRRCPWAKLLRISSQLLLSITQYITSLLYKQLK
jgi:hypothetical protein